MEWDFLLNANEKSTDEDLIPYTLAKQALVLEGQTIIHCSYVTSDKYVNGGWVNICKTTFLVNQDTKDMLRMVDPALKEMLYMV